MIWIYIRYIVKSKALYKEYKKMRRAVRQAKPKAYNALQKQLFNCVLNEKLFWCDLRVEEIGHDMKKSFFPYPKRYEKLYKKLLRITGKNEDFN